MSHFQQSSGGFFWNHVGRVSESLLVYLFTVVVARMLGAAVNGLYATFISLSQLLLILSSFGLETVALSQIPKTSSKDGKQQSLIMALLIGRVAALAAIGCVVLLLGKNATALLRIPDVLAEYMGIVFIYFAFQSGISLASIILLSEFHTRLMSAVKVSIRLVEVAGAYLLIRSGAGLREILLFVSATSCLTMIALLFVVNSRSLGNRTLTGGLAKSVLAIRPFVAFGGLMYINGVFEFILSKQTDVLLMNHFAIDASGVGQYDVATGLGQIINVGMTSGMYGVSVASFSSLSAEEPQRIPQYWNFLSRVVLLLVVPAFVFSFCFAQNLIPFVYSSAYSPSIVLFQVFVLFLLFTRLLGGGVAADYIQSIARPRILLLSSITSGIVNLVVAFVLIPRFGGLGAVIATGCGLLTIAMIQGLFVARQVRVRLPVWFGLKLSVLALFAVWLASLLLKLAASDYLLLLLLFFGFAYLGLVLVMKPLIPVDLKFLRGIPDWLRGFVREFVQYGSGMELLTDRQKWAFGWLDRGGTVVDVGSSISPLLPLLFEKFSRVIAVDTDEVSLAQVSRTIPSVQVLQTSASAIPLETGSSDAVLLLDVLEHVDDEEGSIDEIWRILKVDGELILSVPNKGLFGFLDPQNLSSKLRGTFTAERRHRHYSEEEILQLLGQRFRVVRKHYGGLFLYPITFALDSAFRKHFGLKWGLFFKKLGDLDNNISWGRWSYNIIIAARKA